MAAKHILVFRLSALGDVAMAIPVLRCLTHTYPALKLTIVSRKRFVPLFESIPNISFVTPELYGIHKEISGLYRLFSTLKKLKPTHIADLHQVLRTKILMLFFAPFVWVRKARLDKGRAEKKTTHSIQGQNPSSTYPTNTPLCTGI